MEIKTLSNILEGKILQIPVYKRGYDWEEKQWKDLVQDIDDLIDYKITSHYTGTIVIYQSNTKPTENYGTKKLEIVDVVDGGQRLVTCSIYLSIILKELTKISKDDFSAEIPIYLFLGNKSKLRLNNDTTDFYLDLISTDASNIQANSIRQKRIYGAYNFLKNHINEQLRIRADKAEEYLRDLFDAIIRKLNFSVYPIEIESEIHIALESMNSKGEETQPIDLLRNYLMYWVDRNIPETSEKEYFTSFINKTWREVYINCEKCNGNENHCLNIAWLLYVDSTPKSWDGYNGFKSKEVFPLRDFSIKTKEEVKEFLLEFFDGLAIISKHYSAIIKPNDASFNETELILLTKIKRAGNIGVFLPLIIASRIKRENDETLNDDYLKLLKSLEVFTYRVFLWERKGYTTGEYKFSKLGGEIFSSQHTIDLATRYIYRYINILSDENSFRKSITENFYDWYPYRYLVKYTLFEYEHFLRNDEDKPKLNWENFSSFSIEHILPQSPETNSNWLSLWSEEDRKKFTNDISNLVLTKDNSQYDNFEFQRKSLGINDKGERVSENYYANSELIQERKISQDFVEWTPENCKKRRDELTRFIISNWGIHNLYETNEYEEYL